MVDNSGDIVNETGGNGLDTVQSLIIFSLSDAVHAIGVIENLTLTGTSNINGPAMRSNNVITGNAGNNVLAGLGGADILDGGTGTERRPMPHRRQALMSVLRRGTPVGATLKAIR